MGRRSEAPGAVWTGPSGGRMLNASAPPGAGAGILATVALLLLLALVEAVAGLVGGAGGGVLAAWVWGLGHTALQGGLADIPLRAAVLLVTLGIGGAVAYAEVAEPHLP